VSGDAPGQPEPAQKRPPAGSGRSGGRPTHHDIARLAGTSQATVSLVLNGRDAEARISPATREAVLGAARDLGYVADLSARRLRHKLGASTAPALVLAVLRPAGTPLGVAVHVIEAAQESLAEVAAGAQLVLEEYKPGQLGAQPGLLAGARFHGGIATSLTPEDERFLEETDLPVPMVAFQRRLERRAYVDVDNVAGGAAATSHLLERGRRRIAALSYAFPPSRAQASRLEGYRAALQEGGLGSTERVALAPAFDPAGGAETVTRLLDAPAAERPDAVFALSDVLAVGAMHAIRRAGLRIPEDVAVVGYDDLSYVAYLDPPLTTVHLPYAEMGRASVAWLVAAARGQAGAPLRRVFRPELIVRESS
jgi:DNA-binding LacI/PurR family transcriptional regulator